MPKYRIEVNAKIYFAVEGGTPNKAIDNFEAFAEDFAIHNLNGTEISIGNHKGQLFLTDDRARVVRNLPDNYDLTRPPTSSFIEYLKMCYGEPPYDDADDSGQAGDKAPEDKDVHGAVDSPS
jgi:hypothetical protein